MHCTLWPSRTVLLAGLMMSLACGRVLLAQPEQSVPQSQTAGPLKMWARSRVAADGDDQKAEVRLKQIAWEPHETALVICDMWDKHWCPTATERVGEMAPRMNEVVKAARKRGVQIIHCPSDTLEFYKDTPQRKLAQQAPKVETKIPLMGWCHLDPAKEAPLPINDRDGGCDCDPAPKSHRAWSRQIATIEIAPEDAITDSAEAYYLMRQKGIKNVIVMGVHTNMCVLGRPFSIRQMVNQGQNVVLMRDMTDTMYNPASEPFVSHFTGTDYVVEHIETHWCPSITSVDFLGGNEFRFSKDTRPRLALLIGEDEYKTEVTLPAFAKKHLGRDFQVRYVFDNPQDKHDFPAWSELQNADVALISIRRRLLAPAQLQALRDFIKAGKPIIGIRTASHAFALRDDTVLPGRAAWPEFDIEILGCDYTNHLAPPNGKDHFTRIWRPESSAQHPLVKGLSAVPWQAASSLYISLPLHPKAEVVLQGQHNQTEPVQPVAWTLMREDGGRTFYTSLGHVGDFELPQFQRLLLNGIYWSAGLPVPE